MKVFDIIKLSVINGIKNIKMSLSLIIGLTIIIELLMVSIGYEYSLNTYISETIKNESSLKYARFFGEDIRSVDTDKIEGIMQIDYVNLDNVVSKNGILGEGYRKTKNYTISDAVMKINGKRYIGVNDFSYDFNLESTLLADSNDKSVMYDIGIMDYENNLLISENEINEFENKYNEKDIFLEGENLYGKKQIVMTDYMLDKFGITTDFSEYIGQKISLYVVNNGEEICVLEDYELVGIIDSNFNRIGSRKDLPQIIISDIEKDFSDLGYTRIFFHKFKDVIEFCKNAGTFVMPTPTAIEFAEIEKLYTFFNKVVLIIFVVLVIVIMVFIYTIIYFYYKKRMSYIFMQRAMGINNKSMYLLIFTELFIMDIIAMVSSSVIFRFVLDYTNNMITNIINGGYMISRHDMNISIILSFIFSFVLITGISIHEYIKVKQYTINQLNA